MKIWIDGIIRDMTPEEEEAFSKEHEGQPDNPLWETEKDKAEAYDILVGVNE